MCAVSGKASLPPAHSSSLSDSWACYRTVWWTSSNTFGDGLPQLVLTAAYLCYDPQLYHNCSSTNSFFLAARASLPSFELTRVHDRGNGASAHSMFLPTAFARPHVHCARLSCQHLGCVLNNLAPRHALSTRRLRGGWFFSSLCYSISFNFSFIVCGLSPCVVRLPTHLPPCLSLRHVSCQLSTRRRCCRVIRATCNQYLFALLHTKALSFVFVFLRRRRLRSSRRDHRAWMYAPG